MLCFVKFYTDKLALFDEEGIVKGTDACQLYVSVLAK